MKNLPTIGLLVGMGVASTAPFYNLVIEQCRVQYGARDGLDFPHMLLYSLPTPIYTDRPLDDQAVEATVRAGLQRLEAAEVDFLAMPCNTAHAYYDALAARVEVPLLNMIELACDAIPPETRRAAVLATRMTIDAGLYQQHLGQRAVTFVHDPGWQEKVDAIIAAILVEGNTPKAQALWEKFAEDLQQAAVDTLIIGCTDLNVLDFSKRASFTILDATECLAKATVAQWLESQTIPFPA